ncbi:hypothetical protein HHO41_08915 [Bacillus sp. DNRA2]|uniref:hypothetical protein n=1 Tax=Bacillus sp. DNRA2 TaxID=2723053 RepID=UPI00145DD62D|nr:hypothetical protein [Bacillus sp. DNRA2]NMD70414.1 hypothetical protein [Bacillus sp. DNRA2]
MEFFLLGFNWGDWGLLFIGVVVWGLVIASGLLLLWGIWKKSWKALVISGLAFLVPAIILFTQPGFTRLFILIPLLVFILAYFFKKKH